MKREQGFSLIEVVIAILILTTGLVALAGALVVAVTLPQRARQQELAKQLANEIMESIIYAKESTPSGFTDFDSINYYSATNTGGRFLLSTDYPNVTKMLDPGPDNVFGTCDDGQDPGGAIKPCASTALGNRMRQIDIDPGKDGLYSTTGTAATQNATTSLLNFSRKIIITDLSSASVKVRQVEVQVTYLPVIGAPQTVSLSCRLTNFRTL